MGTMRVPEPLRWPPIAAAAALLLASCVARPVQASDIPASPARLELPVPVTGARGSWTLVRAPERLEVSVDEAADALADADVVFLGEIHDSAEGHEAQLELTRAIAERRGGLVLSMEMLERDAQPRLDLFLGGAIDEGRFLAVARPWPNHDEHYRPALEFARRYGFPVVAANVPRRVAAAVARRGLTAGLGSPWAARTVDVGDGEYRTRFDALMPAHGAAAATRRFDPDHAFAAQCIKDDTMAASIAAALDAHPGLPVVHWNGMFHSDFGLGTVERLRRRRPGLNIAVVSMVAGEAPLTDEDLQRGHYLIRVPAR